MESVYTGVYQSPVGPLYLVRSGKGLMRLDFRPDATDRMLQSGAFRWAGEDIPADWTRELDAYFSGSGRAFGMPLDLRGTPFQLAVWEALQAIPYGATTTYAGIAARVGNPRAARAVGAANGKNPVAIVVPCHRVVAAHSPGGFGGGLEVKKALLALEAGKGAV